MMKKRKMGPNEKSSRKPSANPASAPSPAKEEEEEGKKKERREKRSRKEMNFTYASLDPVPVTKPGKHSAEEKRTHQGIPGIERLDSGRIFAVWYAGGKSECRENYVVMSISDDNGATWSGTVAVADPPHPDVRAFDSTCWISPEGRFHWFWAQGCGGTDGSWENADGIAGVWFSVLENPEDDPGNFRFTPPWRISNGVMMNKPTVLSDGSWALPCSVWTGPFRRHESLDVRQGAMMLLSPDRGKTFEVRGRIAMDGVEGGASFDEHMFVELRSGRILCCLRTRKGIAESFSDDGGRTWSTPRLSRTLSGPDSRFFLRRLRSGRLLLISNDSTCARERLSAFLSEDDGLSWPYRLLLDNRKPVSYPDAAESPAGTISLIYDCNRCNGGYIFLSQITEEDILAGSLVTPASFLGREVSHSRPVS